MKVLKEDCGIAKKIRKLEEFLRKENISISYRNDGLLINVNGEMFVIRDGAAGDLEQSIPCDFDGTRIQTIDDYIKRT